MFRHDTQAVSVSYQLRTDAAWQAVDARVVGWSAAQDVALHVERTAAGLWKLNGEVLAGLEDIVDLDLGFTPATNLTQLQRLELGIGQSAELIVAWLDLGSTSLTRLSQRYTRRTEGAYWYESPDTGYEALLEVDTAGFVTRYPGLWQAEG